MSRKLNFDSTLPKISLFQLLSVKNSSRIFYAGPFAGQSSLVSYQRVDCDMLEHARG